MSCSWCSDDYDISESDAQDPNTFCSKACEDEAYSNSIERLDRDYSDEEEDEGYTSDRDYGDEDNRVD